MQEWLPRAVQSSLSLKRDLMSEDGSIGLSVCLSVSSAGRAASSLGLFSVCGMGLELASLQVYLGTIILSCEKRPCVELSSVGKFCTVCRRMVFLFIHSLKSAHFCSFSCSLEKKEEEEEVLEAGGIACQKRDEIWSHCLILVGRTLRNDQNRSLAATILSLSMQVQAERHCGF